MHIEIIDDLQQFSRVKDNWAFVYEADPEAQIFLSWAWLSKWLTRLDNQWFILAARPDPGSLHYVAFFPLQVRCVAGKDGRLYNEITMAGNKIADYTGLICMPEFEDQAIPAFAAFIKSLHWAELNLEFVRASDRRLALLLPHFPDADFEAVQVDEINKIDNINNCICPYISLPDDWDEYLNNNVSSNSRQKIRRFLRKVEESDEFRITIADRDTVKDDLEILLQQWEIKWKARKGELVNGIKNIVRIMLMHCFDNDLLFLPVLWRGDRPLGALATLIDTTKKSFYFVIGSRDETVSNPPPGLVLHGYSIRYAIEKGFKTYDFLRGNELYKYSFGAREHLIHHTVVKTRNGRNLGDTLDNRSIPEALQRAIKLHQAGRLDAAETGYRQILDARPDCDTALYTFGQLMMTKGDHGAAADLFRRLVAVEPRSEKAWLKLGQCLEADRRFAEAADAYRALIKRLPTRPVGHNNLGHALFQLGLFGEAIDAFKTALAVHPDYPEATLNLANTLCTIAKSLPCPGRSLPDANLADDGCDNDPAALAIHYYRQAITLKPGLAGAHYGLGVAYQLQGNLDDAASSFRKVLELEPDNGRAFSMLSSLTAQGQVFGRPHMPHETRPG